MVMPRPINHPEFEVDDTTIKQLIEFNGRPTPPSLYKFQNVEYLQSLFSCCAYFSLAKEFKDTQDCGLSLDCSLSDNNIAYLISSSNKWLYTSLSGHPPSVFDQGYSNDFSIRYSLTIRDEFNRNGKIGVINACNVFAEAFLEPIRTGGFYCVTEDWRGDYMWDEYAYHGTGFVIEFDSRKCSVCVAASPITYTDAFHKIRLFDSVRTGTVVRDIFRTPLTKLRKWSPEAEWRGWRPKPGLWSYSRDSIRSITFGPAMKEDLKKVVLGWVMQGTPKGHWFRPSVYEAERVSGAWRRIQLF